MHCDAAFDGSWPASEATIAALKPWFWSCATSPNFRAVWALGFSSHLAVGSYRTLINPDPRFGVGILKYRTFLERLSSENIRWKLGVGKHTIYNCDNSRFVGKCTSTMDYVSRPRIFSGHTLNRGPLLEESPLCSWFQFSFQQHWAAFTGAHPSLSNSHPWPCLLINRNLELSDLTVSRVQNEWL